MAFRTLIDFKIPAARSGKDSHRFVQVWADAGAVSVEGSKAVKECECGALVCWVKSQKTGKSYLTGVFKYVSDGPSERWYYRKDAVHTNERCDQAKAGRERVNAYYAERDAQAAQAKLMLEEGNMTIIRKLIAEEGTPEGQTFRTFILDTYPDLYELAGLRK